MAPSTKAESISRNEKLSSRICDFLFASTWNLAVLIKIVPKYNFSRSQVAPLASPAPSRSVAPPPPPRAAHFSLRHEGADDWV